MNKEVKKILSIGVLFFAFSAGFMMAYFYNNFANRDISQKPVIDIKEKRDIIDENTPIIYEEKYKKCGHLIIREFDERQNIEGKSVEQIKLIYTEANDYNISLVNDSLIIHRVIDDWCEEDKNKCRMKEFQGRIAIYKGPDTKNDVLLRVTDIYMDSLPMELQTRIEAGEWEFQDIDTLNDALENLDEYL